MEELDEAIGKLSAAALQISPKDDQIIADHIRSSVALLLKARHKIRERVLAADIRKSVSEDS